MTAYGFGKDNSPASGSPLAVLAVTVTTVSVATAEPIPTVPSKWPEPPTGSSVDPVAAEDSLTVEPDLRPLASSMIPAAVLLPHTSASPARTPRRTAVEVEQLAPPIHKPAQSRNNQAGSQGFIVTKGTIAVAAARARRQQDRANVGGVRSGERTLPNSVLRQECVGASGTAGS